MHQDQTGGEAISSSPSEGVHPQSLWQRSRLIILVAAVAVLLLYVLFLARGALFPFIVSIVLAQLLHPVVAAVEIRLPGHARYPGLVRVVTILLIYVVSAALLAGLLFVTIPPIFSEAQEFIEAFPKFYERARTTVEGWSADFTSRIPEEMRAQVEDGLAAGGNVIASAALGVVRRTISGVSNALTFIIALVIVPFFLFYLLKDRQQVLGGAFSVFSPQTQRQVSDVLNLVNGVIGAYVRAQLFSALIVAVMVFAGLTILGIKYAAILAIVAGLFGLIPIIGAVLGAVPGILVALASSPEQAVYVALVYIIVQLVESNVIAPRIQSNAVRLHPAIIMMVLVGASEVAGLWGVVVGVPLTAAVRDVFLYFHRQWSTPNGVPAVDSPSSAAIGQMSRDCDQFDAQQPLVEGTNEVD